MKILLATDGSNFSDAAAQGIATQFRPQDSEVRVLSVVEPITTAAMPQMAAGYYPELEDQQHEAKALVERTAKMLAEAGFKVSTSVATGDANPVILDEAADWHTELIVVGSHGRKGLGRCPTRSLVFHEKHCAWRIGGGVLDRFEGLQGCSRQVPKTPIRLHLAGEAAFKEVEAVG
jgi:nucleotide-binding universal stress UspA family protein